MIFGIGAGKIELQLEKYQYVPGETIKGTIVLKLKKPTKAKQLCIQFLGEQKRTSVRAGRRHTRTVRIYDYTLPLDGEKEYSTEEKTYSFTLKVPRDIPAQEGVMGTVLRTVSMLTGSSPIRWWVIARLDVPWAIDVTKKVQITVG